MNCAWKAFSLSSQCASTAMNYFKQMTLRTISTTEINNGAYFKGPKRVAPKEKLLKMWYKPKRYKLLTEEEKGEAMLQRMHRYPKPPPKRKLNVFGEFGKPFCKGVVMETLIRKPLKPNSANRKCVKVRLSTGKVQLAYVPGEGHNLQEHNVVLLKIARLRDTKHVSMKCVRGAYDLPHVKKKSE